LTDSKEGIRKLHAYIEESLQEVETGYYEYDEWRIFHDPDLLSLVSHALYSKILASGLEFDYIGALGGSGTPLAIALLLEFHKNGLKKKFLYISDPLVGVSALWLKKIKPSLELNKPSILFVDTEIKSGRTVWDGYQKVENMSAQVKGIAAITDYKGFPDRTDYNGIVVEKKIPVIRLFDFYPLKHKLTIAE
jgi:orotate phosphoribosyltransferase